MMRPTNTFLAVTTTLAPKSKVARASWLPPPAKTAMTRQTIATTHRKTRKRQTPCNTGPLRGNRGWCHAR
eukprot:6258222-Lingulodinium_polyedra.AAC.1